MTQTRPRPENFEEVPGDGLGTSSFFFWILLRLLGHEAAHPLGRILLHLLCGVGVSVQREARAVMSKDAGNSFCIHALLNRQRGERVSQSMEGDVLSDPGFLQQIFVQPPQAVCADLVLGILPRLREAKPGAVRGRKYRRETGRLPNFPAVFLRCS